MSDYKSTLNLPKTAFPMKAGLAQREPEMLTFWQQIDLYKQLQKSTQAQEKFVLHDGPPYANGHIHIGHAMNKILKDMIVKLKYMSGYNAPYVPGWDCHGLPIELNVEKKFGKAGVKISEDEFRKECRKYARSQVDIQREEFKRLGVIGDWDNPYMTMDYQYEADIIRALAKVIERGHFSQGSKPVYWCLDCRSALAEAEVEYEDKHSPSIDVAFTVLDDEALISRLNHANEGVGEGEIIVPIWTTTPWTLPANEAVALNPELEYALVQCELPHGAYRILLAQDLVTDVMARFEVENYRVVAYGQGKALEGLHLAHPFLEKEVPIVLGDHVTTEAGTGCVHTAPAHGMDDYVVAKKYNLPVESPLLDSGCFRSDAGVVADKHLHQANEPVIELLKTRGKLLHFEMLQHSYPHCWRHKTPVIFRATPQWFISMDKNNLRRDALEAVCQVEWIPEWGQSRIAAMIENRPDWCVSRQRSWGTPITLFIHRETRELHPDTLNLLEEVATLVEENGIEAWFSLDPKTLLGKKADDYVKVTDTLDVWFDSGVSHQSVLAARSDLTVPADLYLEGSDQHRGWFQAALLTMVAMHGTAPFLSVLTHGFTVDAAGHKMSKSRGNVVAPEKVMKTYGADILRLWVCATDYRSELSISDEILKRIADAYRRIRNTARFLLSNLFDFDPNEHLLESDQLLALDKWAVDRARRLQDQLTRAYEDYQFHQVYQKIHHFCAQDLGSFYLDIIKDRQYTCQTNSVARRSCQSAMYHIAHALTRWLAPVLSFTAEEIWQHIPGKTVDSVFFNTWYDKFSVLPETDEMNAEFWETVMTVRHQVNKVLEAKRNDGVIGSALAAEVTLYCNEQLLSKLQQLGDELRFVLITSGASLAPENARGDDATETELAGLWVSAKASTYEKCSRCWHRREDIGSHAEHESLCSRCVDNVAGEGEERVYA